MPYSSIIPWLKQNKGYIPIFATADRKLYEQKDEIFDITGIIVNPLYAVGTYRSIMEKPWPMQKTR